MAKTNPEELTKVERSRQERKERLEAQKTGSGDKKSLHVKKKRSWVLPTLVVLAVLVIAAWLLNGYGVPQRFLTAMTVGGEPVKVSEYNYYYNNMRNSYARMVGEVDLNEVMPFSLPSASDEDSDESKSDEPKPNPTWGEFFHQQTQDRIQTTKILVKKATEEGIALDESDLAEIDSTIEAMKKDQGSDLAFNNDLIRRYGKGFNEAELRKVFNEALLVEKYKRERMQKIEISDDEIESYYDQHRDDIDAVSYKYADVFVDPSTIQFEDLPEEQQESLKKIKEFEAKAAGQSSADTEESVSSVAETTVAEDKTEATE
ncbi:MAG: SurA N-terminal domain-containing protein, partial [Eubacteriales bacterium]|nr:SurA N-terminal domain-containing protein [Eubacteriales bacterium]